MKLTEAQTKLLSSLSDEWRREPVGWQASIIFLRLEQRGFCKRDLRFLPNPNDRRWWTRRTPAGRAVLNQEGRGDE
jgi:hypothetical protein